MENKVIDLDGPLTYADFGGEGRTIVLVHGLGGSSVNWMSLAPLLARRAHVIAPDMAGFGRTPPEGRPSTIVANRALLDRFIDTVSDEPVVLFGNSMGGLLSIMEASAHSEKVAGLVLIDPALPRSSGARPDPLVVAAFASYAIPGVGERFVRARQRRFGPEGMVRETLQLCNYDPSVIPQEIVDAHVKLARERVEEMPWSNKAFLEAARSLLSILARKRAFIEMTRRITSPVLIIHGDKDRLVPVAAAREAVEACPHWVLEVLPNIGHTPQLEAPERVADIATRWLDELGLLPAGERAARDSSSG
ncbi:MAG: alpha/beta fold hydrolase [Actinomycetota bacterium]|nr:alpha/beta hydrolase [Actinomycetota bacterium]